MRLASHEKITRCHWGVNATDIHEWIDAFFDHARFQRFIETGFPGDFDPYGHRVHRHCREEEDACVSAFRDRYPEALIRAVFESHVRSDYGGEYPARADFSDPDFIEKHHTK
jgi:hypothetical protein